MSDEYQHQSVLLTEVIDLLQPQTNQNFIDGTLGGGGHTAAILEKIGPNGRVLAFELDSRALEAAKKRLNKYKSRLHLANTSYANLSAELAKYPDILPLSGIVLDLGLSSDQLDQADRGFSFRDTGPLDMRFDTKHQTLTASDIVLTWPEPEIYKIFREYGEENQALRLARGIIKYRSSQIQKQKFLGTSVFVSVILQILNIKTQDLPKFRIHPATKVFQALRIAVNQELSNVKNFLPEAMAVLPAGARLAIISFHSLEDRIVKNYFQVESRDCLCPPNMPVCVCHHQASLKIITKKGVRPSEAEVNKNPRSRSAILRVAEKI